MSKTIVIIPARLESTRLPRKLLLAETGKPLLQYAWEAAKRSKAGDVSVIADCTELRDVALAFGAESCTSLQYHPNGTSRAAEAFDEFLADFVDDSDEAIVVVLQADEPEIDPELIDELAAELGDHPEWDCATLASPLSRDGLWRSNRNIVKVDLDGEFAGDFNRHATGDEGLHRHIGVYAYRVPALRKYADAEPCEREVAESLEQLRALHIGLRMGVVFTHHRHAGIDQRADYDAFKERCLAVRSNT